MHQRLWIAMTLSLLTVSSAVWATSSGFRITRSGEAIAAAPSQNDARRASPDQLRSCKNEVGARYLNVPIGNIQVYAGSPDANGNSIVNWEIANGASGFCRLNDSNEVVNFVVESDNNAGGQSPDPNVPSRVTQAQLNTCRNEVGTRYLNVPLARIQVYPRSIDNQGTATVNWRVTNGASGFCQVNASEEIADFVVESDRPIGNRPTPQPTEEPQNPPDTISSSTIVQQLRSCQNSVGARYPNLPLSQIRVYPSPPDASGYDIVDWTTSTGATGFCRLDESYAVINLVVESTGGAIGGLW